MRAEHLTKILIDGCELVRIFPSRTEAQQWLSEQMAKAARAGLRVSGPSIEAPRFYSDITGEEMTTCHSMRSRPEPVSAGQNRSNE